MDNWDEIRTAYQVARAGTVSGAAEVLGVHHATVIRHVDALETRLGVRLFQRHARGYTPTEAGQDLLQVAQATDDQLTQLAGRIKGQGEGVTGELVVTSLAGLSQVLSPVLAAFQQKNPGLIIRYLTSSRLFRLEYGEAHVAIRAGNAPQQPDNVVQAFGSFPSRLVAAKSYVARNGLPLSAEDLAQHWFVGCDESNPRAPYCRWLSEMIPAGQIIFRVADERDTGDAIRAGAGIGFLSSWEADGNDDLVQILPSRTEWQSSLWLVTHMDLHRTAKVQCFLRFLKEQSRDWPS